MIPPQTSQMGNDHKVINITMSSISVSPRFSGTKNSRFDQFIKILLPVKVTPSVIILLASSSMIWVIFYYTLMVKKFNTLTTVSAKHLALLKIIHRNWGKWSHKWVIAENTWRKILLKLDRQQFEIMVMIFLDCQFCKDGSKQDVPFASGFLMDACK